MPDLDPAKHLETRFPTLTIVFFMKEFAVPLLAATQNPEVINLALAGNARLSASFRSISVTDDPCGAVGEFLDDLAPSLAEAVQDL